MNSLYVTVTIPLLLVLAGFNAHAHGLTTFGKANSQGQQPISQSPTATAKNCTHQSNCTFIKGTTCLKGLCLCGDNSGPTNGACKTTHQGHNHICQNDTDCVEGAVCKDMPDNIKPGTSLLNNNEMMKKCQCLEGVIPTPQGKCGGDSLYHLIVGLIPIMIVLVQLY